MMTTMAALLGGVPLMLGTGTGSEIRQPLGYAMVGGLIVSQALTLFTTPVIYLYLDKLSNAFAGWGRSDEGEDERGATNMPPSRKPPSSLTFTIRRFIGTPPRSRIVMSTKRITLFLAAVASRRRRPQLGASAKARLGRARHRRRPRQRPPRPMHARQPGWVARCSSASRGAPLECAIEETAVLTKTGQSSCWSTSACRATPTRRSPSCNCRSASTCPPAPGSRSTTARRSICDPDL